MDHPDIARILDQAEAHPAPPRRTGGEVHAADIAQALTELDDPTRLLVFALLGDEKASDVLVEADERIQEFLLGALPLDRLVALLTEMDPDDAADVLAEASEDIQPVLVAGLDDDQRRSVTQLVEYEPETAGGIMTTEVVSARDTERVSEVRARLGEMEQDEVLGSTFVVDPAGKLVGFVPLRELLTADGDAALADLTHADVISVAVDADQEEAARLCEHYDLDSVPVVDGSHRLQGVITLDDVIDVLEEEASEDMLRLAGTAALHPTTESLTTRLLARAPWLSVTLAGTFLAGMIIESIEKTWFPQALGGDPTFKSLLYFIPLIGGMAGNVGSQSSTIMVRGFATGEIDPTRPMRVLPGEVSLAAVIGVLSGLLVGVAAALVHSEMAWLGLVIGVALPAAILVAALVGTLVPFGCRRVNVDPAYASGPFLLTLNDIAAYVIYFAVAVGLQDLLGVR